MRLINLNQQQPLPSSSDKTEVAVARTNVSYSKKLGGLEEKSATLRLMYQAFSAAASSLQPSQLPSARPSHS